MGKLVSAGAVGAATRYDHDWKGTRVWKRQKSHVLMEHNVGVNYTFCSVGEKLSPWCGWPVHICIHFSCLEAWSFLTLPRAEGKFSFTDSKVSRGFSR